MPKRTYAEFAADDETNLVVLTADGARIPAHAEVLRLVCSCLKNAPASDTWDLRQLLVDGNAPTAGTVTAVFEIIYQALPALDFEMDQSPGRYSLLQLRDMLLFADAVGCSKRCLENICSLLGHCVLPELEVSISSVEEEPTHSTSSRRPARGRGRGTAASAAASAAATAAAQTIKLQLDTTYSINDSGNHLSSHNGELEVITALTEEQQQQLRLNTCQQLESLLYTAFKLGVKQLQEPLLLFLRNNVVHIDSVLWCTDGPAAAVLSARVLAVAGTGAADLVSTACLQLTPVGGIGIGTIFKVHKSEQPARISFTATMMCDMYEFTKGSRVFVGVDLVGGYLSIEPCKDDEANSDDDESDDESDGDHRVVYDFGTVLGPSSLWKQSRESH